MKQASTVSNQFHVSLEETAAILAVLAKLNITGSAAGTATRNMLTEMAAPSNKARDAMRQLNLEMFDSNRQFVGASEGLRRLKLATDSLSEKGRTAFLVDVFNERGVKGAEALLSNMDFL